VYLDLASSSASNPHPGSQTEFQVTFWSWVRRCGLKLRLRTEVWVAWASKIWVGPGCQDMGWGFGCGLRYELGLGLEAGLGSRMWAGTWARFRGMDWNLGWHLGLGPELDSAVWAFAGARFCSMRWSLGWNPGLVLGCGLVAPGAV
jgi:hypothetical protein